MARYDVLAPCIVGGRHYTRPATGVEVGGAEAAKLVESGHLRPQVPTGPADPPSGDVVPVEVDAEPDDAEPESEPQAPRRRGGRAH